MVSAQLRPLGSIPFPRPIVLTPDQRHARRRAHQADYRATVAFSAIALGWAKPRMGASSGFVTIAREVLGR